MITVYAEPFIQRLWSNSRPSPGPNLQKIRSNAITKTVDAQTRSTKKSTGARNLPTNFKIPVRSEGGIKRSFTPCGVQRRTTRSGLIVFPEGVVKLALHTRLFANYHSCSHGNASSPGWEPVSIARIQKIIIYYVQIIFTMSLAKYESFALWWVSGSRFFAWNFDRRSQQNICHRTHLPMLFHRCWPSPSIQWPTAHGLITNSMSESLLHQMALHHIHPSQLKRYVPGLNRADLEWQFPW